MKVYLFHIPKLWPRLTRAHQLINKNTQLRIRPVQQFHYKITSFVFKMSLIFAQNFDFGENF